MFLEPVPSPIKALVEPATKTAMLAFSTETDLSDPILGLAMHPGTLHMKKLKWSLNRQISQSSNSLNALHKTDFFS